MLGGKIFLKSRGTKSFFFSFLDENLKKKPFLNESTKKDVFPNIGGWQKNPKEANTPAPQLTALHIEYTCINFSGPFISSKFL